MLGLILAGCMQMAMAAAGSLGATDGYVRAMPPGQPTTAAYLILTNNNDDTISLVSADSPAAKRVEFHQHIMSDKGVAQMRPVDKIKIEAGESFTFKPGGYHIMLMQLVEPLKEGQEIPLLLEDENGKRYSISLPVKNTAKGNNQHAKSHHHH